MPVALAALLFFLSGAAALVDQVLWQRVLALTSGVGVVSSAIIVGGFMLGLGIGSEMGGRWSARVSARRSLLLFAAAEGIVGLFSLSSTFLYYDVLYTRIAANLQSTGVVALVQIVALFVPTFAMGLSFPLLARACATSNDQSATAVTRLFAANVLGSAFGAIATPWIFLRFLSIPGTLGLSASFSFVAAIGALLGARRFVGEGPASHRAPTTARSPEGTFGIGTWCVLFLVSGVLGLGLEMVWFRVVEVVLKGTAFTFGTVLGLYLLGLGMGALFGGKTVARRSPLASFIVLQCFSMIWAIGSLLAIAYVPATWPMASEMITIMGVYFGRLGPGADAQTILWFVFLPAFLFLPATFAMGLSYRVLQDALQAGSMDVGRRTGLLQACNILGSTIGSLLIGLVVLQRVGAVGTLRGLAALVVIIAIFGLVRTRSWSLGVAALIVALVAALLPSNATFWMLMHGRAREGTVVREDASSVVALSQKRRGGFWLFVNGVGHSELPYGGVHTSLGVLGLMIHDKPEDVAVVGLGSGNTSWAALARSDVRRVVTYEIAPAQYPALLEVRSRNRFNELDQLFRDPRLDLRFEDGRLGLRRRAEMFDLIEIDALYPWATWSGNIYSTEFFELCRSRLKAGGLLVTWAPTERVQRTVRAVFPYARIFENDVVVASMTPFGRAQADRPGMRAWFGEQGTGEVARFGGTARDWSPRRGSLNTDLSPRDEFSVPQ